MNYPIYLQQMGAHRLNRTERRGFDRFLKELTKQEEAGARVVGYIPGDIVDGKLKQETLRSRCMITLHASDLNEDAMKAAAEAIGHRGVFYRASDYPEGDGGVWIVVPLSRYVTAEEYEAIARMVAARIGMECFEAGTFSPLMVAAMPLLSDDGTPVCADIPGEVLDPAEVLAMYDDWRDRSVWPLVEEENGLPEEDGDDWFDRLQEKDEENFIEQQEAEDEEWKKELYYKTDKDGNKTDVLLKHFHNVHTILSKDYNLRGFAYNIMADRVDLLASPPWMKAGKNVSKYWRDADDAQLASYLALNYVNFSQRDTDNAFRSVADDRSFHPVLDYLDALPEWDGVRRLERVFCHYLGAAETEYTYAVTRKMFVAAVMRVREPGCKVDSIVVLFGKQGMGKSTIIAKFGMEWYSDALRLSDTADKTASEKLQGIWIMEIGELAGMKKAEVEGTKAFLSYQSDRYRAAYGKRTTDHPRQCIMVGTTNKEEFLRDTTGNRRFWPVRLDRERVAEPSWNLGQEEVDQIWAEAQYYYRKEETAYLPPELEAEARKAQGNALERDDRQGIVEEFLGIPVPSAWDSWDMDARVEYFNGYRAGDTINAKGAKLRERVCVAEIWCECFRKPHSSLERRHSNEVIAILESLPGWERIGPQRCGCYGNQIAFGRVGEDDGAADI